MRSCPVLFIFVHAVIISSNMNSAVAVNELKHEQNIGTVLFERSDSTKHCWTTEELIILNSRRMFQDLLPKVKVINYENDEYIALLMDYIHICLENVRKLSVGKTKHLMLKALADTVGGYLQVYILPLTRQSYYTGNIKYRNAKRLFELYDELKIFLRTNGAGWMKPNQETNHVKIPPIVITPPKTSVACNGLITYPPLHTDNKNRRSQYSTFKKKKRLALRQRLSRKVDAGYDDNSERRERMIIPLPFLDDDTTPNSIALPFKKDSLLSLYTEKSAFVLVKYYVASVKCILSRTSTERELRTFNKNFLDWLQQSVRQHLNDEKWFPAFGGVLRVIATLEESVGTGITKGRNSGTYQMMPKIGVEYTIEPDEGVPPLYKGKGENEDGGITFGTTELISIAVVSALLVWLLVGLSLVCYRFLTKHWDECPPCEAQNLPVTVLYKDTNYCHTNTCSSKTLHKGLIERLKDWWRNKFGKCPGGCQNRYPDEERCLGSINYTSKDVVDTKYSKKIYRRKKYAKSVSTSPSDSVKDRASFRRICYSSDGSASTNSDSFPKPR